MIRPRLGACPSNSSGRVASAVLGVVLAAPVCLAQAPQPQPQPASSCVSCHSQLDGSLQEPAKAWSHDVHREAGLGCEACHGGNPSIELADDPEGAMSPARGFRPAPDRLAIPRFCGDCHANAEFMKQYNPQARVDQLAEYRTSVHGMRNAHGDPVPATCIDCHGAHGILHVASPESPVYATNVPKTCARCHADAAVMAPYGIPTDQYEDYLGSAHAAALLDREDTAAPACNDCHGNHGAAPPGVESVANVCGQCHGREASLFRASFKKQLFDDLGIAECTVCHGNHRVVHPTPELFRSGSAPEVSQGEVKSAEPFQAALGDLDTGAKAQASWSVVVRPHVEADDERLGHRISVSAGGVAGISLDGTIRPGEASSDDLRREASSGGLAAVLVIEPLSGLPVTAGDPLRYRVSIEARGEALRGVEIVDKPGDGLLPVAGSICLTCHSPGDECDRSTVRMDDALIKAIRSQREAETLLRRAELAGMDVSDVKFDLNSRGKTAVVEASALIHAFKPDRLIARAEDASGIAATARQAARAALAELQYRRRGLAVSLVLIVLVLVGLYLKIREIDHRGKTSG